MKSAVTAVSARRSVFFMIYPPYSDNKKYLIYCITQREKRGSAEEVGDKSGALRISNTSIGEAMMKMAVYLQLIA